MPHLGPNTDGTARQARLEAVHQRASHARASGFISRIVLVENNQLARAQVFGLNRPTVRARQFVDGMDVRIEDRVPVQPTRPTPEQRNTRAVVMAVLPFLREWDDAQVTHW